MSSVQEIEKAITHLSSQEQEELFAWIDDRFAQSVDAKLAGALDQGLFDERIQQALSEQKAGSSRTL